MNAPARLGAYTLLLGLVLGGGAALGATLGPEPDESPADPHGGGHAGTTTEQMALPGLAVSDSGYTFVPETTLLRTGTDTFRFRITSADGEPVTDFDVEHDKELHLVAVSRDLARYAHVHPVRDATGVWSVDLPGLEPGAYRVFADFRPAGGPSLTLGVDAFVPGDYAGPPSLRPSASATVDDFEVTLAGDLHAGQASAIAVHVSSNGQPASLEPYLGADGHLVAIRVGDLAYLHVHPDDRAGVAGDVGFTVEVPSAGRYRLFFDFQVDGVVRTAAFTVDVPLGDSH
jgi:hypothetical protein